MARFGGGLQSASDIISPFFITTAISFHILHHANTGTRIGTVSGEKPGNDRIDGKMYD
jgi:hypothetical protein